MCIAQTIISYPFNLFYLASTLVCIAQDLWGELVFNIMLTPLDAGSTQVCFTQLFC